MIETRNALIEGSHLGPEDHGIFSAYLTLNYGESVQSFGGYALDKHNGERNANSKRVGTAFGMEFIRRIMETVGVEKWEDLKGKYCRARMEHDGIEAIGHIIEDRWFYPKRDLEEFKSKT